MESMSLLVITSSMVTSRYTTSSAKNARTPSRFLVALQALFHVAMSAPTTDSVLTTWAESAAAGAVTGDAVVLLGDAVVVAPPPLLLDPPQAARTTVAISTSAPSVSLTAAGHALFP
jgi:hypothetical protein